MRYILTLLLVTGFLGIPSCVINDCEDVLPYWDITDFELSLRDFQWNEYSNKVFTGDTLCLWIDFEHEFQAQYSNPFIQSGMANEPCTTSGEEGPKDKLTSVEVTSTTAFDEYQSGELLNSLIQGSPSPFLSLEDWVNHLNSGWAPYFTEIFFTHKPAQQQKRTFTVKLIFDSGKEITVTTEPIIW